MGDIGLRDVAIPGAYRIGESSTFLPASWFLEDLGRHSQFLFSISPTGREILE
jgi:hypothetical protein